MLFALVLLALSGLSLAEECTNAHYPPNGQPSGEKVPIKPAILEPGQQVYNVPLGNNCKKTNYLELEVCDYDVPPAVQVQNMYFAVVTRLGALKGTGVVRGNYYCN